MKIRLIRSFLKDQIIDSILYFIANFLIIVFYSISVGKRIEILYPLSITMFVYLIWMLIRFSEYYKMYRGMEELMNYSEYQDNFGLEMNKKIMNSVKKIHIDYMDRLSEAESLRKRDRRFISMWIHNMKTPITVTDLLLQRMENATMDSKEVKDSLVEENKKLLGFLDQVLNIMRLEEFAKDYIPEPIDLVKELKAIINKNKNQFIYNNVYPKLEAESTSAMILSDKKWNELMLHQLISNAVKYSKDENSSKYIHFIIEASENQIILTIKDEGIGIPKYDLGKVCEPFFTGENGRKGYGSSGIGLYFCKEVCNLLGHTMEITSEINEGTTVKITYLAKL